MFNKGNRVVYLPPHVHGDVNHKDSKEGVVSSQNKSWIFVKFDNAIRKMVTGDEEFTAAACSAERLIHIED